MPPLVSVVVGVSTVGSEIRVPEDSRAGVLCTCVLPFSVFEKVEVPLKASAAVSVTAMPCS